jgi:hypothetical protein
MLDLELSESPADEYHSVPSTPVKRRQSGGEGVLFSPEEVQISPFPGDKLEEMTSKTAAEHVMNKAIQDATARAASPQVSPFDHFNKTLVHRSRSAALDESWSVFTVRRDLPSLGAMHAELTYLLKVWCSCL